MAAKPRLGWVQISSVDPPVSLVARLGADKPSVDQGYGGWSEVARPRRSTLSVWVGSPALRITLPIQLDAWATQASVERECAQLERLASPIASDGTTPRVRVAAPGAGIPYQGRVFVVDNLTWGDAAMNRDGSRVRQQVSLSLLEYVADVRVDGSSASQRQRQKQAAGTTRPGASEKRVRVAPGDTLSAIAARKLGDATRWTEIATLNGIRDPRSLTTGQLVRLP